MEAPNPESPFVDLAFAGRSELITALDQAVGHPRVEEVTSAVQATLVDLLCSGTLRLPAALKQPRPEGYARRLVYKSPELGYAIIAMTWGPRQGTPLHDHAGVWCVEGVVEGQIDVTQYQLMDRQGERWRFQPQGTVRATLGTAGCLIPPFEYHTIANALPDRSSVTIHVYGQELERCTVFEGPDAGWYAEKTRRLGYVN